ncbi:MAG: hypothetical protein FWB97_02215 [Oscillospiraceae bacterium]|nr:hypothetical protein [Oscillospiraceae bacterium]
MGIEHYAFALFIAGLICLIAVLVKVLFSDLSRQRKLLDEKETKLLQLYNTVESIMEDFTDQAKITADEIKEFETRMAVRASSLTLLPDQIKDEHIIEKLPQRPGGVDQSRIRAASEVLERAERIIKSEAPAKPQATGQAAGEVFQSFFDEIAAAPVQPEVSSKQNRNNMICALAAAGKTDAQIASELGITQNEVRLVLDLMGS